MKKWSKIIVFCMVFCFFTTNFPIHGDWGKQPIQNPQGKWLTDSRFGNIPLYFIPNQGQVNGKALFYTKTTKYTLWLNGDGMVFQAGPDISRLVFLNAVKNPALTAEIPAQYKVHYFKGRESTQSFRDIPTSRAVRFKSLYNHIDLKVYGVEKQIEYDWIVKPGGNPGDIRFQYQDVNEVSMTANGDLAIRTGSFSWTHKKPVAYQVINGQKTPVAVDFAGIENEKNTYSFKVGSYNKDYELIIDPIVIAFSANIGGNGELIYGLAVNSAGEIYVTGYTPSFYFPVVNPYQSTLQGSQDAFVSKFNADGTALVFSTYLGGNGSETAYTVKLDDSGNVYVGGGTSSSDFPTVNPIQGTFQGVEDGFITKLSPDGSTLLYSTYLGGTDSEQVRGIDVNGSGELAALGNTFSTDFPVQNALQSANGGGQDIFVAKLSASGGLVFSTYLGGSGGESDPDGPGIAMDSTGAIYAAGATSSTDFPVVNAIQSTLAGGSSDGFIAKLSADGSTLVYSTYLGGSALDSFVGIDTDSSGAAYVTGYSDSTDFPTTSSSYMPSKPNSGGVVVIAKISSSGSSLAYSTYFGGPWEGTVISYAIAVGASGSAYITGRTDTTIPLVNPVREGTSGSDQEAFLAMLSPDGSQLNFSSYIGRDYRDEAGYAVAVDSSESRICMGGRIDYAGYIVKLLNTTAKELTVTCPNGAEEWAVSSVRDITWTASAAVEQVKIQYTWDYLGDYDSQWITIAESVPNTGSYSWTIPNTPSYGMPNCYVRIMGPEGYPLDRSDEGFYIRENTEVFISLDKPNGNEECYIGVPYQILWSSGQSVEYVSIEYTTDDGITWTPIAGSIVNTGSYSWTVPNTPSSQCRVRVWDPSVPDYGLSDISSGMFTIKTACIPLSERNALIALYNSTNGGGWYNKTNWRKPGYPTQFNDRGTENTWWGVTCNPENTHVISISLPANNLYGNLPSELYSLLQLTSLNLEGNILGGSLPYLGSLSYLETLQLNQNYFSGNIPTWINTLTSLKVLKLNSNEFTGAIPSLAGLTDLETLNLADNVLTGSIPALNSLTHLNWIDLGANGLSGSIPDLSSLTQLTGFLVNNNQLTGNIPNLSAATQLTDLNLYTNHITGNIPSWIGGLSNLQRLYLAGNQLTGPIPTQLGNLAALQNLSLASNGLTGEIPGTLANLTNLQNSGGLYISYNGLYTGSSSLSDFLQSKHNPSDPWMNTQTIAPTGITAGEETLDSIKISWTPILYQAETGGYRVYYSTIPGHDYTLAGTTANKSVDNYTVTGLESGVTYYFVVSAFTNSSAYNQNAVVSDYSTEVSAATEEVKTITVSSPNGGESWEGTTNEDITWTYTGTIDYVMIEYSTDSGSTWNTITDSTANSGSYKWTVLNTPSTTCLVKVSDAGGTVSDQSDAVFTITAQRTITVTLPNGGENLLANTIYGITWTNTGNIPNVMIEYSINSGSSWNTIIASTTNSGSYNWTIPAAASTSCLVKVSDTAGPAFDQSNAVFTISSVTYCASSGSSQTRGYISNVQVGSLNNSSGSSGYTNFTTLNANLTAGSSTSVVFTPTGGTSYTKYWKIWIDYNRDGDFVDSGENVISRSGRGTLTGSFTVPVSTVKGTARMRVSMRVSSNPTSCATFSYGEVEDYTANIQ